MKYKGANVIPGLEGAEGLTSYPPSLKDLFSQAPASFAWSERDGRTIGTSVGFALDLWPDRIEAAALFPPDDAALIGRNSTLLQLLLVATRPDWQSSGTWLATAMRTAARSKRALPEEINITRGVRLTWDRAHSRATLRIRGGEQE